MANKVRSCSIAPRSPSHRSFTLNGLMLISVMLMIFADFVVDFAVAIVVVVLTLTAGE